MSVTPPLPAVDRPNAKKGWTGPPLKFILAGVLVLAAIVLLIATSTNANSQYYMTIEELKNQSAQVGNNEVRISGVVLGNTIHYDKQNLVLTFEIANIPGDEKEVDARGGIAKVLHDAAVDPTQTRLKIVYHDTPPDLLKDEAQAIITGKLAADGSFNASELLLKCPTRYQDALPEQSK